jgi:hypothetical protein
MRPRPTPPRPWQPLSDAGHAALLPFLPASGGLRGPWRALRPDLGRADSAHRQRRRWARAGMLDTLLRALAAPRTASSVLRRLEYRLCRAWRRRARLAGLPNLLRVRRLGLYTALPGPPGLLPDPDLSETRRRVILHHLAALLLRGPVPPRGLFALLGRLVAFAGGARARARFRLA